MTLGWRLKPSLSAVIAICTATKAVGLQVLDLNPPQTFDKLALRKKGSQNGSHRENGALLEG